MSERTLFAFYGVCLTGNEAINFSKKINENEDEFEKYLDYSYPERIISHNDISIVTNTEGGEYSIAIGKIIKKLNAYANYGEIVNFNLTEQEKEVIRLRVNNLLNNKKDLNYLCFIYYS